MRVKQTCSSIANRLLYIILRVEKMETQEDDAEHPK